MDSTEKNESQPIQGDASSAKKDTSSENGARPAGKRMRIKDTRKVDYNRTVPTGRPYNPTYGQTRQSSYQQNQSSSSEEGDGQRPYQRPRTEGGYNQGDNSGYQRRSYNNQDGGQGGYQHRSYNNQDGGQGGYQRRSYNNQDGGQGGYQRRSYNNQDGGQGGYQRRSYNNQDGGQGGYQRRSYNNQDGGQGGYQRRSYNNQDGGQGGYQRRSYNNQDGGQGGYQRRSYNNQDGNGQQGGYQQRRPYNSQGGGQGGYQRRPYSPGGGQGGYQQRRPMQNRRPMQRPQFNRPIKYQEVVTDPTAPIRLNKYLANAGVCSRREADEFIQAGVVKVNDQVVTELGTKITRQDKVMFHDQPVQIESKVYILLNKPKNCVTTSDDPQNRMTVMDLVKTACQERIYPVGRLDRNTTGVLLLTNDGEMAAKLTHPSFKKKKIYHVWLDREVSIEDMEKLANGIDLEDGEIHADAVSYANDEDKSQVGIEIHSGKNRVVRRMFEMLGYHVIKLDRVYFAGLTKKNLPRGKWKYLSEQEVNALRMGAYE